MWLSNSVLYYCTWYGVRNTDLKSLTHVILHTNNTDSIHSSLERSFTSDYLYLPLSSWLSSATVHTSPTRARLSVTTSRMQQGPTFPRTSQDGLLGNLPFLRQRRGQGRKPSGQWNVPSALRGRRDMQSVPQNHQRLYDDEGYKNSLSLISLNWCPTVPTVLWVKSLSIEATARPVTVLPPVQDKCLLFLSACLSLELLALQSMRPCFTPSSPLRAVSKAAFGLTRHRQ